MAQLWKVGGILFATAAFVMLISLFNSINSYHFEEWGEGGERMTWSEACDDVGDYAEGRVMCDSLSQAKYLPLWGVLMSAGLAIVCFAKDSENDAEPKQAELEAIEHDIAMLEAQKRLEEARRE